MDYRTDFYSFGVTLYELLTGRLPFVSDNPLELVHSQIAKMPPPPHAANPDLPAVVSAVVQKLLAKNAEDRYQSAYGIVSDLRECLRQWQASGRVEPFEIGRYDRSDKLYIPQKLYGREQEIATLSCNAIYPIPHIRRTRPRSVLCAPLLNNGKLTGILYLENNLTVGAFTPDRLEVLKLLAAQTAISIENARLYADVEQSERKYRALFEDSRDTIFITGAAGEILDINPAGVRW